MSRHLRFTAVFLALTLVLAACEDFSTSPAQPTVTTTDDSVALPGDPADGCVFDAAPGDPAFGALLCEYQALLLQALSSGVIVDSALMDQVTNAIATWVLDPAAARATVEAVIAEIQRQIAQNIPLVSTATVGDLTDGAFSCMTRAGELLQIALDREAFGGLPIPEMDSWQTTFDYAAVLAESGDIVGATSLVCALNTEMESILFQD